MRLNRRVVKIAANRRSFSIFLTLLNVVLLGIIGLATMNGARVDKVLNQDSAQSAKNTAVSQPLDQSSSADIAVNAARIVNLPETPGVVNQAQSVKAEQTVAPADTTVIAKPQAVATTFASAKDIKSYTVQAGESVSSIAAKFNVTSDSIMWSNNLSGNTVSEGTKLWIPPMNGIVYSVQANDTVDSIASKYLANKDQIIAVNDIELTGLKPGEIILIPNGQRQVVPTIVSVSSATSAIYGSYNGYDYGFCTWYAANRRAQIGRPVPSNLGNANTWAILAAGYGIPTGASPQVGAVAVKHSGAPGHVAIVESVNADGSFWISEMNSFGQRSMTNSTPVGGWGVVDWKLIPASLTSSYTFVY